MKKFILAGIVLSLFAQTGLYGQEDDGAGASFGEIVQKHARAAFDKDSIIFTAHRMLEVQLKRGVLQNLLDNFIPKQDGKKQKIMQEFLELQLKKLSMMSQNVKHNNYDHLDGLQPIFEEITTMKEKHKKTLQPLLKKKHSLEKEANILALLNPKQCHTILAGVLLEFEMKELALKEMSNNTNDPIKKAIYSGAIIGTIVATGLLSVALKVLPKIDKVVETVLGQFNVAINRISTLNFW